MHRRPLFSAASGVAAAALLCATPGIALAETVNLTVSKSTGVSANDPLTVTARGADPKAGYYVSICVKGTTGPTGPQCLGDRAKPGTQQWVSNAAGATTPLAADGTFTVDLTAVTTGTTATGTTVDCAVDACAVTVFHDHRNGFDTVSEAPITVAPAGTVSPAGTGTAAGTGPGANTRPAAVASEGSDTASLTP